MDQFSMDKLTYGLILLAGALGPGSATLIFLLRKGYATATTAPTKWVLTLGVATLGALCGRTAILLILDLGVILDLSALANRAAMVGIAMLGGLLGPGLLAGIHQLGSGRSN